MDVQARAEPALIATMEALLEPKLVELTWEACVIGVPVAILDHKALERLRLVPWRPPPKWSGSSED